LYEFQGIFINYQPSGNIAQRQDGRKNGKPAMDRRAGGGHPELG